MRILFAVITGKATRAAFDTLAKFYEERISAYIPIEIIAPRSESSFWEFMDKQRGRVTPLLVLLDSRGKQFSSENFAARIGQERDQGRQLIVFAIGPADGWSEEARERAGLLLSFGPMTLPHELARVVLCEQVYRAFTILAGHPYHSGH